MKTLHFSTITHKCTGNTRDPKVNYKLKDTANSPIQHALILHHQSESPSANEEQKHVSRG